eukprot:scaffold7106_cov121-Cylindrotheca_fusiformis.AAC.2
MMQRSRAQSSYRRQCLYVERACTAFPKALWVSTFSTINGRYDARACRASTGAKQFKENDGFLQGHVCKKHTLDVGKYVSDIPPLDESLYDILQTMDIWMSS